MLKVPPYWQFDKALSRECEQALAGLHPPVRHPHIAVYWNPRLQTTAGQARIHDGVILLNPKLHEINEGEVRRTLLHELAHLIVHWRFPRRRFPPHGREWQRACVELGIPGERARHTLPWQGRNVTRHWLYICNHCGTQFERVRRIRQPVACLKCCRQHNLGRYTQRFRLIERPLQKTRP